MLLTKPKNPLKRRHHKVRTGCITCRKRRIKCDEGKNPGCNRCAKASLECEGYDTPKAWIFEASTSRESTTVARYGHPKEHSTYKIHFSPLTYAVGSTIAWRSSILNYSFGRWLPAGSTLSLDKHIPLAMWSVVAEKAVDASSQDVLTQSLLALALVVMSVEGQVSTLQDQAVHYYQRVLVQLRQKINILNEKALPLRKETMVTPLIVASLACSLIEYALNSWEGTDSHLRGIEMLFKAHGPSILNNPANRKVFFDHRIIWTCCSFIHRQAWLYSDPSWNDFSWAPTDDFFNSPLQQLFTLASAVPPVMQKFDKGKDSASRGELWAFYLQFSGHLATIDNWKAYMVGSCQLAEPLVSRDGLNPVLNNFSFSSSENMMTHSYYSGLRLHIALCVWEAIRYLRSVSVVESNSELNLSTNEQQIMVICETEAMNICQSIQALLAEHHGLLMTVVLIFTVDTAWTGFQALESWASRDISAIRDWFGNLVRRWKSTTGFHPLRQPWAICDSDNRSIARLPTPNLSS